MCHESFEKKKSQGSSTAFASAFHVTKRFDLLLDRSSASPADSVDVAASHFITKNCETAMLQFWIWHG